MGGNDLKKANKLYRSGKYSQVLQLLEAQIFRYRQNFLFYYILGMSCIHTGDYSGAASFLQRALSLRPGDEKTLLGMAVVHLKQQKTSEALQDWFEVIDQDPKNIYAARGLAAVKKFGDPDELADFTESRQIRRLVPSERRISFVPFLVLGLCGLALIAFYFLPGFPEKLSLKDRKEQRTEIVQLDLSVTNYASEIPKEGEVRYLMSSGDIRKTFEGIIDAFHSFQDNRAQRDINMLRLSNASAEIKDKVMLLEGYIRIPSFDSLDTNYSYLDVLKDPQIYENCYAIWKGKVSNLNTGQDTISFDLLAGYETEKVLEGIVPVSMDFAGRIDPSFPIEVLGRIEIDNGMIRMKAVSIHQFVQEEE